MQKTLLSGVKPTGTVHIGNYFGAMRQFVDHQDDYRQFIFLANYHALTSVSDGALLRKLSLDLAIDYLAIGIDPKKTTLFLQSDVPEVTELAWIFNTITTVPYLSRAHAYKDAEAKNKEVSVGLFDYPILMAADILIYGADVVPVGLDQKQHIEIARDTAQKFNRVFGETFKIPEPIILEEVKTVPGTDGRKMSKSYNNVIGLFASDEEIKKAVMSIPTDSKGIEESKNPSDCKVFAIHELFPGKDTEALRARYIAGGIGYKESKDLLIEKIIAFVSPMRALREEIAGDTEAVLKILKEGAQVARREAQKTMSAVREKVGLTLK
ncbi:MAG: tryptophan--tRNA ligase [Candidatus Yonathbacteria bacterium RIFCSPHIGHO2_01_FULL_44_41]|uniref:Tryptophan--tRNA ligase n=1 Tax=Candidatus Yonathbacteria bacterium RIFCSPHIGHO2_02_FULL_44_14 TaxID=1802724 RepID=A0A1G2SA54_9BACT|nr:MAG: tryptophan--tRNA ligase [Candidatus Yonathbacteria bacterium RIFCSPHIGHO2_01_FULL_44_41]OHA81589.1 MAG: tryptophan--tRNA ligase [Candidatus Yonathbacteria bacterium RIFCSPHIGHO2_02_FULL_44_14]OHA81770.1 MAG: tryptophan--tRNA ligase [Candidatus Yonathbacteria bacterium RIFCSPLOWO2_01_FULL_43_20]